MKSPTAAFDEAWKRNESAHCMSSESVGAPSFVSVRISLCALGHLHYVVLWAQFFFDVRIFFYLRNVRAQLGRLRFLPSSMGCNSKHRVVMGDMYGYRKWYEQAGTRFHLLASFWQCVFV